MKIGIYPGSFNPFHWGHFQLMLKLIDTGVCDEIIIIPTPEYWDKKELSSQVKRASFINNVIHYQYDSLPQTKKMHIAVLPESKTFDLLQHFRKLDKENVDDDSEYSLIIGADNVKKFDQWYNWEGIVKDYKIIIVGRSNYNVDLNYFSHMITNNFEYVPFDYPLSSTEVRDLLRNGENIIGGIYYNV